MSCYIRFLVSLDLLCVHSRLSLVIVLHSNIQILFPWVFEYKLTTPEELQQLNANVTFGFLAISRLFEFKLNDVNLYHLFGDEKKCINDLFKNYNPLRTHVSSVVYFLLMTRLRVLPTPNHIFHAVNN